MLAEIFGVDGIVVLIVVLVVLFGGAAIPKLARNLGSAKNEFEKGLKETKPEGDVAGANPATNGAVPKDAPAKAADEAGPSNPT
jgi:Sec-independent protein translocase protein TatA